MSISCRCGAIGTILIRGTWCRIMLINRLAILVYVLLALMIIGERAGGIGRDSCMHYDNFCVVRAYPKSADDIDLLHRIGAELLSCHEGIRPTDYILGPDALAHLKITNIRYEILSHALQPIVDQDYASLARSAGMGPRDNAWFADYKTFSQIVEKLQAMADDRPDLCTLVDIGDTIEGRDIWALHITGPGSDKPVVLFNGTQHAREWISPMVNMYIADALVYRYDTDPIIQSLVDRVEFIVIPVVNADGYIYTLTERMWRKNRRINGGGCDGVDLNRNWGYEWGGVGSSGDTCSILYRGTAPFSEPETAAVRDYIVAHPRIISHIDFHSYSQLILTPWGHTEDFPHDHCAYMDLASCMHDEILAVHGKQYQYGATYSMYNACSGIMPDWVYGDRGAFSFTFELRPLGLSGGGFELPSDQILPTCEENLPAALYLAEWSSSPVKFLFPNDVPSQVDPGVPITVPVDIKVFTGEPIQSGTEIMYYRVGFSSFFTAQPLIHLGGDSYEGTLPAISTGQTIQFYFEVQTTGDETYTSPDDAPSELFETAAVEMMYQWDLGADPGWTTEGEWEHGQPTGGGGEFGGPDPTSGNTGPNVYGYNLNGDYPNNLPETHLTTTAIDCTGLFNIGLRFHRWLGVEMPAYDRAYVRVSNDGTNWTNVWQNQGLITDSSWSLQEIDISAIADDQETVYIRWTMGETDGGWRYCGWNIDDIELWAVTRPDCPGDLNGDNTVNINDIFACLGYWGHTGGPGDINEDGIVNIDDIFEILGLWGDC